MSNLLYQRKRKRIMGYTVYILYIYSIHTTLSYFWKVTRYFTRNSDCYGVDVILWNKTRLWSFGISSIATSITIIYNSSIRINVCLCVVEWWMLTFRGKCIYRMSFASLNLSSYANWSHNMNRAKHAPDKRKILKFLIKAAGHVVHSLRKALGYAKHGRINYERPVEC